MTMILSDEKFNRVTKIRIVQDDSSPSPFEFDLLGELIFRSKLRYNIGRVVSDEEVNDLFKKHRKSSLFLHVYAYIHSGICLSSSHDVYPFNCPFDTSYAGFIHVPFTKIRETYHVKRITEQIKTKVYSCLNSEIEIINQWLNGDVYGFITENMQAIELDSCWGFYGHDPFKNGMSDYIDSKYHHLLK